MLSTRRHPTRQDIVVSPHHWRAVGTRGWRRFSTLRVQPPRNHDIPQHIITCKCACYYPEPDKYTRISHHGYGPRCRTPELFSSSICTRQQLGGSLKYQDPNEGILTFEKPRNAPNLVPLLACSSLYVAHSLRETRYCAGASAVYTNRH